jgi:hypothetical protein
MGLIVNDTITLKNGMKVTGAYLSFYGQSIGFVPGPSATLTGQPLPDVENLRKTVDYTANGSYSIWFNKEAKDSGLVPVESGNVDYPITKDLASTPLHTLLYQYVKTNIYKNTTDA